jgi:hypothetical protein
MKQKILNLHFRYTTSKGRDTYGYNICTLLVNGDRKGRCKGGGYDMKGTSFANWLQSEFQDQLQTLFKDDIQGLKRATLLDVSTYTEDNGEIVKYCSGKGYYGTTVYYNPKARETKVSLDGACGFSSIERIANAIGIELKWNKESDRYTNHTYYTAIYTPIQEKTAIERHVDDIALMDDAQG